MLCCICKKNRAVKMRERETDGRSCAIIIAPIAMRGFFPTFLRLLLPARENNPRRRKAFRQTIFRQTTIRQTRKKKNAVARTAALPRGNIINRNCSAARNAIGIFSKRSGKAYLRCRATNRIEENALPRQLPRRKTKRVLKNFTGKKNSLRFSARRKMPGRTAEKTKGERVK